MEVSVIGSFKVELAYRELGFCNLKGGKTVISSKNRVCFGRSTGWRKSGIRFTLRATAAIQSEPLRSDSVSGRSRRSKSSAGLKLQREPSIFFTDRAGQQYKECLSVDVDDLPVLDGKTPVQVYRDFCESFKSSFSSFMGSTITGISMGLGPDGELRYPSHQRPVKSNKITGVGEFQCYDKNMPSILKQHAEANGNPLKQHAGPPLIFAPPSPPPPGPPGPFGPPGGPPDPVGPPPP